MVVVVVCARVQQVRASTTRQVEARGTYSRPPNLHWA